MPTPENLRSAVLHCACVRAEKSVRRLLRDLSRSPRNAAVLAKSASSALTDVAHLSTIANAGTAPRK
jgi:hypothetical protein